MPKIAYLDETGTASLKNIDTPNVSNYFIVAAVVIDANKSQDFTVQVELNGN